MGPLATCKHVCAAILAVCSFKEGMGVNLKQSSTETLQAFHKPARKYTGEEFGKKERSSFFSLAEFKMKVNYLLQVHQSTRLVLKEKGQKQQ